MLTFVGSNHSIQLFKLIKTFLNLFLKI